MGLIFCRIPLLYHLTQTSMSIFGVGFIITAVQRGLYLKDKFI
jgi:hypothetical protein